MQLQILILTKIYLFVCFLLLNIIDIYIFIRKMLVMLLFKLTAKNTLKFLAFPWRLIIR